jgi:hypothetical protein
MTGRKRVTVTVFPPLRDDDPIADWGDGGNAVASAQCRAVPRCHRYEVRYWVSNRVPKCVRDHDTQHY